MTRKIKCWQLESIELYSYILLLYCKTNNLLLTEVANSIPFKGNIKTPDKNRISTFTQKFLVKFCVISFKSFGYWGEMAAWFHYVFVFCSLKYDYILNSCKKLVFKDALLRFCQLYKQLVRLGSKTFKLWVSFNY